ncbi:hypothetical protein VL10_24030 [Leclercia adecarboxylata]|nr:hypothetical protein VL10_24030 [Leclercia adecarboxylata]KMN66748.1 hypothetical protein VK95_04470 [Leclercia sp. LK8]
MQKGRKHNPGMSSADRSLALLTLKGRDRAVAGLIWQPVHTVKNVLAEARSLLKQEKCEYFLTYVKNNRAQCGMAKLLPSDKRCWSAVMMLCLKLGDSWLGLFRLPGDRYWLAGIDNGMVVPGCDTVFDQLEMAKERYRDYADMFAWQKKYVSDVEGIDGQEIDLLSVLQACTLKSSLRVAFVYETQRRIRRYAFLTLFYAALLVSIPGGWKFYQLRKEEERQASIRAEILARQRVTGFAERAWRSTIPATTLLSGCMAEINKQPVLVGSWQIADVSCDGHQVITTYRADLHSTVKEFIQQMSQQNYRFKKGVLAEITHPIKLTGDRHQEKLQPIIYVVAEFLEKLQLGIAKGKIDDVLSSGKKIAKYTLTTELVPMNLISGAKMDGVVIRQVNATLSAQGVFSWTITGEIYGK